MKKPKITKKNHELPSHEEIHAALSRAYSNTLTDEEAAIVADPTPVKFYAPFDWNTTSGPNGVQMIYQYNYAAEKPYRYEFQYPNQPWVPIGGFFTVPVRLQYGLSSDTALGYGVRVVIPQ